MAGSTFSKTRREAEELAKRQLYELEQYEKIAHFCKVVFSGKHPRVKVPTALLDKSVAAHGLATTTTLGAAPAKLDAIFVEKSDELIVAEIQLERQRIERSLRDDLEEQRAAKPMPNGNLSPFEIADILAKAIAIEQSMTLRQADKNQTERNVSSDQFDDDTFYSSPDDIDASQASVNATTQVQPSNQWSTAPSRLSPGTEDAIREYSPTTQAILRDALPGAASQPEPAHAPSSYSNTTSRGFHASVGARYSSIPPQSKAQTMNTDSSSQGGYVSKKSKKKKRKAERQAAEALYSPRVKPEPRSPSPFASSSQNRPAKRQRHAEDQDSEASYDPATAHIAGGAPQDAYQRYNEVPSNQPQPQPRYLRELPSQWGIAPSTTQFVQYADPRLIPAGAVEVRHFSTRADGYREAPMVTQPTRIYVDEFGREYIEPPSAGSRQSTGRAYDDNRVAFAGQQSSPYSPHRGVLIASEHGDRRDTRYRGYSEHPSAQALAYAQAASAGYGQLQQTDSRAASMLPMEPMMPGRLYDGGRVTQQTAPTGGELDYIPPYLRSYNPRPQFGGQGEVYNPQNRAENVVYMEQHQHSRQPAYPDSARDNLYR